MRNDRETPSRSQRSAGWKKPVLIGAFLVLAVNAGLFYYMTGEFGESRRTAAAGNTGLVPAEVSFKKAVVDELSEAIGNNKLNDAARMLDSDASYNIVRALLLAAEMKNMPAVQLILEHKQRAYTGLVDGMWRGKSALNFAVENIDLETAELLLVRYGANPNSSTVSVLWDAVERGSLDMVELLLRYGADPNKHGRNNLNVAGAAQEAGLTEIHRLLKQYGGKEYRR